MAQQNLSQGHLFRILLNFQGMWRRIPCCRGSRALRRRSFVSEVCKARAISAGRGTQGLPHITAKMRWVRMIVWGTRRGSCSTKPWIWEGCCERESMVNQILYHPLSFQHLQQLCCFSTPAKWWCCGYDTVDGRNPAPLVQNKTVVNNGINSSHTVDRRNSKQPPGMFLKPCK